MKFFTFSFKSLLVACGLLLGSANAWGDVTAYSENYEGDGATCDWTSGNTGRYTTALAEDGGNHYVQVSPVGNGNSGALITSNSTNGKAASGDNYVLIFDLKITGGNNQLSWFQVNDANNYNTNINSDATPANCMLLFKLTEANGSTWKINNNASQTVTLNKSNWNRVKLIVVDGETYLTVTDLSTSKDVFAIAKITTNSTKGGLGGMQFATKRYYSSMAIDNVVVREIQSSDLVIPTPTFTVGSYNYEEGGYAVTPSCDIEGATLTYTIGGGSAKACTSGVPFYAKGGKLNILASKEGWTSSSLATDDQWTLNPAPSSSSPETLIPFQASSDNGDKNIEHVYKSVTIAGGNNSAIAGIVSGNATALKLRTGNSGNTITLNVNSGYTVTKVSISANSNTKDTGKEISLTGVSVDGGDNILAEATQFPISTKSAKEYASGTISASDNIVFTFDNGSASTKQIQATIKVWYKTPTENAYIKLKDAAEALRDVPNDNSAANSTLSSVITTQNAAVEAATTDAEIITAKTALQNAVMAYIVAANPITGNQFDLTILLTNPNVEGIVDWDDAAAQGWFTDIPRTGLGTYNNFAARTNLNSSKNAIERFTTDVCTTANTFALYQKVTLPAGNYSFDAYALANNASNIVMAAGYVEGDAVTSSDFTAYSVDFTQASNSEIKLGVKIAAEGTNAASWMAITGLKLYKEAPTSVSTTISAAGYATFNSDFALDLDNISGATAYIVKADAASGDKIVITPQTGKVAANTGLILKGAAGTVTIPVAASGTDISATNKLVAVTEDATAVAAGNYVLGATTENSHVGLYKLATTLNLNKGQAYLPSGFSSVKVLNFIIEGETPTGVEAPAVAETEEDGVLYNTAGQQVTADYKGIVIKNGKKYLNK
jgi:hypothetical protein